MFFATAVAALRISKPSVLIISGAGHTPAHFEPLQILLEESGYAVHSPRLPSNSILPPNGSFHEDVNVVKGIAKQLADEGKEVVALMHSYGGFLGTQALAGLGLGERAREGLTGGVKWLAYMAALIPTKGETPVETETNGGGFEHSSDLSYVTTDLITYPKNPSAAFYHDLSPEAQKKAIAELTGFSLQPFKEKLGSEAWREIRVAYLKCENDQALPAVVQQGLMDRIRDFGIEVQETSCNSSHSPFLSQPQSVVHWIDSLY